MKKYPSQSDFPGDQLMYGICALYVGIGVYTLDRKFSWPDPECTSKEEYESWVKHLKESGYEIPAEYVGAHV